MAPKPRGPHRGMNHKHTVIKGTVKSKAGKAKVRTVMHEYKHRKLHIGKSKHLVKSRKQAIAIAIHEAEENPHKKH